MCFVAAALPHFYLNENPDIKSIVPRSLIKIHCRGRVDASLENKRASVELGEISSGSQLDVAVGELGLKLAAMKWCVNTVKEGTEDVVQLSGRLFRPRSGRSLANAATLEVYKSAQVNWGYCLSIFEV